MGSLVMHIAISNKVKEKYNLSDKFLIGSILPDIRKMIDTDKEESHYFKDEKIRDRTIKTPDIERFIKEKEISDEYNLGYLAHLIEDRVWYYIYSEKYFKPVEKHEKIKSNYTYEKENHQIIHSYDELVEKLYEDYDILNNYIIEKYQINIIEINKKAKEYFNNEEKYTKIIDNLICKKEIDISNKETFFIPIEDIEKYYDEAYEEVNKVFEKIYNLENI